MDALKSNKDNSKQLLDYVKEPHVRAIVALAMLRKNIELGSEYVDALIKELDAQKDYGIAADLAGRLKRDELKLQFLEKQMNLHEEKKEYGFAATIAKELGMTERAITDFDKAGWFLSAAEIAKEKGMEEVAKTLYLKQIYAYEGEGKIYLAVETAKDAGLVEEAIGVLVKANRPAEAVLLAMQNKMKEKAFDIYIEAKLYNDAEEFAHKHKMEGRLVRVYVDMATEQERKGENGRAGLLFEKAGLYDKAINNYQRCHDFVSAARAADKANRTEDAKAYARIAKILRKSI